VKGRSELRRSVVFVPSFAFRLTCLESE